MSALTADVDGDGTMDQIDAYRLGNPKGKMDQRINVVFGRGGVADIDLEHQLDFSGPYPIKKYFPFPAIRGAVDMDGESGVEIFVAIDSGAASTIGELVSATGTTISVVRGGADMKAKPFQVVIDSAMNHATGARCRLDGVSQFVVTSVDAYSDREGYWRWSEATYVWRSKRLVGPYIKRGLVKEGPDGQVRPTFREHYEGLRCGTLELGAD